MPANKSSSLFKKIDALINEGAKLFPEKKCEEKIVCEYYDAIKDDFLYSEGTIISFIINSGMSFISKRPFNIKMPVLLRRKKPFKDHYKDDLDIGKHAQVISCKKTDGQKEGRLYKIGVQFYNN